MYRRSVTCSYCYKSGHNRLGCQERKTYVAHNPESYEARRAKREEASRKRSVESRTCTYCKDSGHNRRGCKILKEDKQRVLDHTVKYRARFLESMEKSGISVGALVLLPCNRNSEYSVMHMVTKIGWHNISHRYEVIDDDNYDNRLTPEESRLLETRVVGTTYPENYESKSYWDKVPTFNELNHIDVRKLSASLGDVVSCRSAEYPQASVTPATSSASPPTSFIEDPVLPTAIMDWYNFSRPRGTDDWRARRCTPDSPCWKSLEDRLCE